MRRFMKFMQESFRRFFHSPGGYINGRIWWLGTRKYTLLGGIAGIGLFLLLFLIFWYPVAVGYLSGALTAGLLAVSIFMIARYLYRKQSSPSKGLGMVILLMGGVLAVILGLQVVEWVSVSLSAWWPQEGWLFLDSFLVGLLGGTAYGNYKTLSRRKSLALASLTTFLLALAPFFLIALMSLVGVPLPL